MPLPPGFKVWRVAAAVFLVGSPLPSLAGQWRLVDSSGPPSSSFVDSRKGSGVPLGWRVVSESQVIDAAQQSQPQVDQPVQSSDPPPAAPAPSATPKVAKSLPIVSVGAGVRMASQDTTNATVEGAVRIIQTGDPVISSISIRPAVIFPDSGCSNCDPEYRLAGTVDFFQSQTFTFYVGGGAAFNKDAVNGVQNAETFAMFTGGVEINLSRNFAITANLNLINQPSDPEFGGLTWADAETSILFTTRF